MEITRKDAMHLTITHFYHAFERLHASSQLHLLSHLCISFPFPFSKPLFLFYYALFFLFLFLNSYMVLFASFANCLCIMTPHESNYYIVEGNEKKRIFLSFRYFIKTKIFLDFSLHNSKQNQNKLKMEKQCENRLKAKNTNILDKHKC